MEIINTFNQKLYAADMTNQVRLYFRTLSTDEGRIKYILHLMSKYDIIPRVHYDLKNDKKSEELRIQANKIYVSNPLTSTKCIVALKLYTQSIANASCSSKQLAISYGNRSAVLHKLRKYEESIRDIDRALSLPYPDNLKSKIKARRATCVKGLRQQKRSNKKKKEKNIDKNKLAAELCPFKVKTYNSEIPCASDAINIKYSKDYGRHVVAARDIKVGETIALEKAYSTLLSSEYLHTHCSHCLKVCWANIPCNSCTYAMYCSEECRAEEWEKYHDVECAVIRSSSNLGSYEEGIFALRIAVQAVRQSSIDALRKELVEVDGHYDPRTKGFSKNGTFESDRYRSLLSLVTNIDKLSVDQLMGSTLYACSILYFVTTHTNMFGTLPENNFFLLWLNPDVTFFGCLLLRNIHMIRSNCYKAMALVGLNAVEPSMLVLPFCSLLNHDCNANTTMISRNKDIVVIALYPIKSGKQIFSNYGQYYYVTPKAVRQQQLYHSFKFICDCLACREDWPLYVNTKSYQTLVRHRESDMIKIRKALQKLSYYIEVVCGEGNVADNPDMLFDLLAMIEVLFDMVPIQSKEMTMISGVVKHIYYLQGDRFELPLL